MYSHMSVPSVFIVPIKKLIKHIDNLAVEYNKLKQDMHILHQPERTRGL